jgi:hypothetical protein
MRFLEVLCSIHRSGTLLLLSSWGISFDGADRGFGAGVLISFARRCVSNLTRIRIGIVEGGGRFDKGKVLESRSQG